MLLKKKEYIYIYIDYINKIYIGSVWIELIVAEN